MKVRMTGVLALASMIGPAVLHAQDLMVLGGGKLELNFPEDGAVQELSSYVEVERAGLYGGVLGLVSNDTVLNEIDLYAGYRDATDAGFSYDLFYKRYFYPSDSGSDYGEIGLSFGQEVGDKLSVSADLTYDPQNALGGIELGADYLLAENLTVSANYGVFQQEAEPNTREWDLGLIYHINESTDVAARYFDDAELGRYFGIAIEIDTRLFGG